MYIGGTHVVAKPLSQEHIIEIRTHSLSLSLSHTQIYIYMYVYMHRCNACCHELSLKSTRCCYSDLLALARPSLSWRAFWLHSGTTRVAVCCRVLQSAAECCSVLQCVAVCSSVLQCVAVCCRVLKSAAVCCSVLQSAAVCCSVLHCAVACAVC